MANMVFNNVVWMTGIILKCLECLNSTKLMHNILDMIEAYLRSKTAPLLGLRGWDMTSLHNLIVIVFQL